MKIVLVEPEEKDENAIKKLIRFVKLLGRKEELHLGVVKYYYKRDDFRVIVYEDQWFGEWYVFCNRSIKDVLSRIQNEVF